MLDLVDKVLPGNRKAVDEYLSHYSFLRLELLLRSTKSASSTVFDDQDLAAIISTFTNAEEKRFDAKLASVGYEIDAAATIPLITGPGRIERVRTCFT